MTRQPTHTRLPLWGGATLIALSCAACGPPPRKGPSIQYVDGRDIRDVYRDAVAAYKAGDYPVAYRGFAGVWSVEKKPKVAGNLGRTELKLKKYCGAVEHLTLFLAGQADLPPDERAEVERLRDRARWSTTTLQVTTQAGAEILVDDTSVGKAPIGKDLCLDPGKHKVEARVGDRKVSVDVYAAPGGKITKKLDVPG